MFDVSSKSDKTQMKTQLPIPKPKVGEAKSDTLWLLFVLWQMLAASKSSTVQKMIAPALPLFQIMVTINSWL